jgi:hypothetical protein
MQAPSFRAESLTEKGFPGREAGRVSRERSFPGDSGFQLGSSPVFEKAVVE